MMKSSNCNMMRRQLELQGPRPTPLVVSKSSKKVVKKKGNPSVVSNDQRCNHHEPVVVYLISPKIIHVQPEEFMGLVQRLTGNNQGRPKVKNVASSHQSWSSSSSSTTSCLISQLGDFSESQQKLKNNRVEYYADVVPFGIPTTTTPNSNFAEIF